MKSRYSIFALRFEKRRGALKKRNVKSKEIFERKFGRKPSPLIFALPFKKRGCSSKENAKAEEIFKRKFASKLQPLIFAARFKKAEVLQKKY